MIVPERRSALAGQLTWVATQRRGVRLGRLSDLRYFQVATDSADQVFVDLAMSRYRGNFFPCRVEVDRVAAAFSQQSTAVSFQVANEIAPLHAARMRNGSRITS